MTEPTTEQRTGYQNRIDKLTEEFTNEATDAERRKELAAEIKTVTAMYKTLFNV
jgi:hypothetical protein